MQVLLIATNTVFEHSEHQGSFSGDFFEAAAIKMLLGENDVWT
jgi:hypothetical protein